MPMENKKQEDLDIITLVKAVNGGIKSFFDKVLWLINFSLKHFLTFLPFIIVFCGLFLGLYYAKKPVYKSTISLSHIRVENDYCYQMIKNLDNCIDGKFNSKLASELSLATEYASQIISINYLPLNNNISLRFADSVTVLLPFKIEVEVYDTSILDSLQKCLFNYLENNEYAKKLKGLDDEALGLTQNRLKSELHSMDSLKTLVEQSIIPRSQGTGIILGEPINPVEIYKESVEMFEKQIIVSKALKSNDTFKIRVGFPKFTKRSDAGPVFYVFLGILFGYFTGLVVLVRRSARKNGKVAA